MVSDKKRMESREDYSIQHLQSGVGTGPEAPLVPPWIRHCFQQAKYSNISDYSTFISSQNEINICSQYCPYLASKRTLLEYI